MAFSSYHLVSRFFKASLFAFLVSTLFLLLPFHLAAEVQSFYSGPPLYYYQDPRFINFGDYLSLKIVERILNQPIRVCKKRPGEKKFLALGSILFAANDEDVVWGSGSNEKRSEKSDYSFTKLDVRAVRGPLTRQLLIEKYGIACPEIYGEPALLFPYLFPEFQKAKEPSNDFLIVVHYNDIPLFPKESSERIVYATDPWDEVLNKILDSRFVVSSSLHGVVLAEAYGIPARLLRLNEKEPLFKFQDYYLGTGRRGCEYATSVEEAMMMGGEVPPQIDLEPFYRAFPFDLWPEATPTQISF